MRLLVDLQRVSELVQSFSGCLEPETIAKRATDGLVEKFDCAFARIWLMEPDGSALRLVASSGMYTHTDGFFARVPLGAFKVGKIAQNRIPFLSNNLADEPWVKDREWAIANHITGFAGYPLSIADKVVGVLAVFSHHPLSPEFLEVLQGLCTTLTLTLENSLQVQQQLQSRSTVSNSPLSEQLATILSRARFSLVGTERPLPPALTCLLLQLAEVLQSINCTYCRFSYGAEQTALEAMVLPPEELPDVLQDWVASHFENLHLAALCLGGNLNIFTGVNKKVVQIALQLPYCSRKQNAWLRIHSTSPALQAAFTYLAYQAGLQICLIADRQIPLLTDDWSEATTSDRVLWIASSHPAPKGVAGKIDLTISPSQLCAAVKTLMKGETWNIQELESNPPDLSGRELEVLHLLADGARDRDIANTLYISERTVKFHINNILTKLKARTRCQAIYLAVQKGWLKWQE